MNEVDVSAFTTSEWVSHWCRYRDGGAGENESQITFVDGRTKQSFRNGLGEYFCKELPNGTGVAEQVNTSKQIMKAVQVLIDENPMALLNFDVIEEVICIRFASKNWQPIDPELSEGSSEHAQTQIENYANRRRFLITFFEELLSLFENIAHPPKMAIEEASWLRDFWQLVLNCVVVEVFIPSRVDAERELVGFRPNSYNSSILGHRFVRSPSQSLDAIEQRAPWIDSLLLKLLSRTTPFLPYAFGEALAALELEREHVGVETQFQFLSDASDQVAQTNHPCRSIEIRYFGKSFERLLDRPISQVTQYLLEAGSSVESLVQRDVVYTLHRLLSCYSEAANKMSQHFLDAEVYFPPEVPQSLHLKLMAPNLSAMPRPGEINPARDVSEVYEVLETIA